MNRDLQTQLFYNYLTESKYGDATTWDLLFIGDVQLSDLNICLSSGTWFQARVTCELLDQIIVDELRDRSIGINRLDLIN